MTTTGSWPTPAVRADRGNGGAPRPPAGLPDVAELGPPDRRQRPARARGQAGRRARRTRHAARRGPPAGRGRAGRGEDVAGQGAGGLDRLLGEPGPVHPGPAARRHHRHVDLQPADRGVRVPPRARCSPTSSSRTRSTAPRRRPSPRCWSAWPSTRSRWTAPPTRLASPFLVVATQNPIEMDGTYPLPEAQRDRFTARVSIGYPDPAAELAMLDEHAAADPLEQLRPVADARHGAGGDRGRAPHPGRPRGAAVLRGPRHRDPPAARAAARRLTAGDPAAGAGRPGAGGAAAGAGSSCPTTCSAVAVPVLAHRLLLAPDARAARRSTAELVHGLLTRLPVPAPART